MGSTLAILTTMTTYGTWLRGDARGWVDDGTLYPPDPVLEAADRARMKHEPYYFDRDGWLDIGQAMGESLIERKGVRILALTIQRWHSHFVIGGTKHHIAEVVKCAKDAVRWHLRIDRPIWSTDYDKRWCFDMAAVRTRVDYVEKHNLRNGWVRKPWAFITPLM
jgi:hypothetical protein